MTNLQPGPEMDKAVAERMGWKPGRLTMMTTADVTTPPKFSTSLDACYGAEGPIEWIKKNKKWYTVTTDSKPPKYKEKAVRFKYTILNSGGAWLATGRSDDSLAAAVCEAFIEATA